MQSLCILGESMARDAPMDHSIAIAGSGIAGLASAIALHENAGHIRIFEQASQFSEVGAGLQLGPNAMRALQAIGCRDEVQAFAYAPPEIHLRDGLSGKLLRRIKLGTTFMQEYGSPYLVAHRADLHAALLRIAATRPKIEIIKNCSVASAVSARDHVAVSLEHGEPQSHRYLLAADGIKSRLRCNMFAGSEALSLSYMAHRCLLDSIPVVSGIAMGCVNLWMTPWGHVVHYPVGAPARLNIVAVTGGEAVKTGFSRAAPALQSLLDTVPVWLQWPVAHVPQLSRWSSGNVCLVGDAAHGTVPFLAQGAAMALEDSAALKRSFNLPKPLEAFEQLRKARVERLDRQSRSMAQLYHAGFPTRLARNVVLKLIPDITMSRQLDWVYRG
jgi:2-polyprenyl-6-methoxyphenol hydroxylase-like FAD-dependent oxidoreductase